MIQALVFIRSTPVSALQANTMGNIENTTIGVKILNGNKERNDERDVIKNYGE